MKTAKCRDAPASLTREEAAAVLDTSTYWVDRLVRENKLVKDAQKRITQSSLQRFQHSNDLAIQKVQAEVIHAYEIGLSMFKEGAKLDLRVKDTYMQALNAWICELGELDRTTARDSAGLKAFLTQDMLTGGDCGCRPIPGELKRRYVQFI